MLQDLLAQGGITRVHWIRETSHPRSGGIASMGGDYMRVVLVLSGRRDARVTRDNRFVDLSLGPGECVVMSPHTWLVTHPRHAFVSLGAVFEGRNPRLVSATCQRKPGRQSQLRISAPVEIMPGLCDDTTMALAAALLSAETGDDDQLYARRLAEALWLRVVQFRMRATSRTAGKAHVTYGAAEHFVRDNLNRPIDRMAVARFLRINPGHVTRLFLRFAGESFGGYLLRTRLESARRLLSDPRLTVSEVGYLAGFTSPNYFVRAYRQRYGLTPGRDRERVQVRP